MTSLARIRPSLRRAAFVAALGALMVPATAGAAVTADASAKKKKAKPPVVTSVRPMQIQIGQTLEVRGKYFLRGRNKNSVVFKRDGGRAVFVKAGIGTTKLLRVKLPAKLEKELRSQGAPTRFRVRVLTKKLGKRFTTASRSPVISAAPAAPAPAPASPAPAAPLTPTAPGAPAPEVLPEGDCDADGQVNRDDADDDNDLLSDDVEAGINSVLVAKYGSGIAQMNLCSDDTDDDGVEDGYEYKSAKDLNDDEYQQPNTFLPYPGKKPYANPLFKDAGIDYDGDALTLAEEYRLWKFTYAITRTDQRTLTPLSYSDGEQYSRTSRDAGGHRQPTLANAGYDKREQFVAWAGLAGYRNVQLQGGPGNDPWDADRNRHDTFGLFDTDRSGAESGPELSYNDIDPDGWLSDDERDEDADGLTNYDETHGRMTPEYWKSCYTDEMPFQTGYAGTDVADADSDGDGVRDGADDQDHDDIPNLNELSRMAASGLDDREIRADGAIRDCQPGGNFSVSGGPLPDRAVLVTFRKELGDRNVAQMTGSGAGLTGGTSPQVRVTTTQQGGGGVDEQQTVTITGGPTGGDFTLTFGPKTTSPLAYNSDAATVEAALMELVPTDTHPNAFGRVSPFNPCLPATFSRTCPRYYNAGTGAPFDDSQNWWSLQ